ncbi:protein kinase domain-containing protein [Aliiglaciecola litoralis]|uniref:non-specific serine/threonine protein kinase n=1 Tax=Aliiglaciecola litoralis TaxID=582857 RepID=A0ABN1LD83_9ALTE
MSDHIQNPSNGINLATQPLRSASQLAKDTILVQRFSIIEPLGSGAQGNVYHAYDQLLETDVAIKVVETSLEDPSQLDVIRNEVLIARQLQHQNIIRIHDVFEDQGLVFFTMELIAGVALIKRLEKPISRDEFERWTQQLFSALSACEAALIKHGDIKPDNILIDENNNLRLIDFGIGQHHSDTLQTSGHQDFSAPEVIYSGQSSVQSELFSAGKIIQLMLANVDINKISITARWWQAKHSKFATLLSHPNQRKRPSLAQANDFYHAQHNRATSRYKLGLLGVGVALCILVVVLWKQMGSSTTETLPTGTIQLAILHDPNAPLLTGLAELLEMPLLTNQKLALVAGNRLQETTNNLALNPISVAQDRVNLATMFSLDAMIILTIDRIQADDFLIRASIASMPANISIGELTRSINANTLESDLADFATALFDKLEIQLSQQFDQSEADALLPSLSLLTSNAGSKDQSAQATEHTSLAKLAPKYAGAWYQAAMQAWQQGDIQTAQENLQTLFELQSHSSYWLLSGRLLQAEMNDDVELALQAIEKLNEGYPQRPDLLAKRAEIYEWANEMQLALADYQQASELSPNNADILFKLARLKILSGETQSAIDNELTRALLIYRKSKDAAGEVLVLNAFGVAHLRLAEYETAEKYLKDALALLDPKEHPLERAKSLANLANVDSLNGKHLEAKEALEEASQILEGVGDKGRQAHVLDTLGFIHEEQGLYSQALNYYKRGLDILSVDGGSREQAQSMSNVAYMHFLIGDYSLADIYWQQAKALFSKNNEQLHLQRTKQNIAQLSLAKGDHLTASRTLTQVSAQLDSTQKQEQMINKLLFSYLNFAEGALKSALSNMAEAERLARDTEDARALTEVYLWHGEVCLKIFDLDCLQTQIDKAQNSASKAMIEQQALLNWLTFSYNAEMSELGSDEPIDFVEKIKTANIPVLTEMKILLDIQERLQLPLNSQTMQRLEQIIKPIYYQQHMNLLFLKSSQPEAKKALREQLNLHPKYWRNHIYYRIYDDAKAQQKQQSLSQEWMMQLNEEQAKLYRERYFDHQ